MFGFLNLNVRELDPSFLLPFARVLMIDTMSFYSTLFGLLGEVIILIYWMISSALRNASLYLQVFLMPKGLNWKLLWLKDRRIVVLGIFLLFFLNIQGLPNLRYISLISWKDTLNWMMEDSGSLTQKAVIKFFKDSNPTC